MAVGSEFSTKRPVRSAGHSLAVGDLHDLATRELDGVRVILAATDVQCDGSTRCEARRRQHSRVAVIV